MEEKLTDGMTIVESTGERRFSISHDRDIFAVRLHPEDYMADHLEVGDESIVLQLGDGRQRGILREHYNAIIALAESNEESHVFDYVYGLFGVRIFGKEYPVRVAGPAPSPHASATPPPEG